MNAVVFHNKTVPDELRQWFGHMSIDELIEGRMVSYGIDVQGSSREEVIDKLKALYRDDSEEWIDDDFELEVIEL